MNKMMILTIFLCFSASSEANADLPAEAYYKHLVFREAQFGYKDKKIIFPKDNSPRCNELIKNKSYSCQGSKTVTIDNINNDSFEVSTTLDSQQKHFQTSMKESLIETQNVCYYEADFHPLSKYQYYKIKKLNCNALTNDICDVIFDAYHAEGINKNETIVDQKLFKRFIDILKSDEYQKEQLKSSSKSYTSLFNFHNSLYGKGTRSSYDYPKNTDKLDHILKNDSKSIKYTSLIDLIDGQGLTNFKELASYLDKKTRDLGYFDSNYISGCYGLTAGKMFKNQVGFARKDNEDKTSPK